MKKGHIVTIHDEEARLRRKVRRHFKLLGFTKAPDGTLVPSGFDKQSYRDIHSHQRTTKLRDNKLWIEKNADKLITYFASGDELRVDKIRPRIEVVYQKTWQSNLFRLASYYWRIPVSEGYGRRIRFLVWDDYHNKIIGLFALGDAVFNLKARDQFIGWDHHRRKSALVNMMDAYALGALPPYNMLLGGKLVASLIQTREVFEIFQDKYKDSVGIISGQCKNPRLVAVTTSSALGKSSIYNRLKLNGESIFQSIGYSSGWGHFHISDDLFEDLRTYLAKHGDSYANSHNYGGGPNYRLRVVRKAFANLGLNPDLARHGLKREVFISTLAENAIQILRGDHVRVRNKDLPTVETRANDAMERWVIPRSERMLEYRNWKNVDLFNEIMPNQLRRSSRSRRKSG